MRRSIRTLLLLLFSALLLTACSAIDADFQRTESTAFTGYTKTYLGRFYLPDERAHREDSGVSLVAAGRNAFAIRLAMTELAERSLDLQYYIWDADQSGRILGRALLRSADRGVRVRLLIDDLNVDGRDQILAKLDAHPNIEIRLFNPFAKRKARFFNLISDFRRLNHRMHNKLMIADNALALLGGRNIGDHYFDVSQVSNYRDLDIAAVGPVVRDASRVFDYFWNRDWSVPVAASVNETFGSEDLAEARAELDRMIDAEGYPYPVNPKVTAIRRDLSDLKKDFVWAPASVVWDDPVDFADRDEKGKILKALTGKLDRINSELLMENAYFVPTQGGADRLKQLAERGVKVRILTNSLGSNDVVAVHAGYAAYRKELLEAGIGLYEVRADSAKVQQTLFSTQSKAGLHTKAAVFDGVSIFVGSFNLDPRSANLNTEIGLYVESPVLARRLRRFMNEGVQPGNSYRLALGEDGEILWITEEDGREVTYTSDPGSTFTKRLTSGFISIFPIEGQL
ncbi:phospholipase D family protein [Rhodobacterales bacterium]|nr:phospholipase D family protein [Rhodobacterales bacterium]